MVLASARQMGCQKQLHLLELQQGLQLYPFDNIFTRTQLKKMHQLLQLLQQILGSCSLFNKTMVSHVHKEVATYRKPEGASPSAAVAAATWQQPPVWQTPAPA